MSASDIFRTGGGDVVCGGMILGPAHCWMTSIATAGGPLSLIVNVDDRTRTNVWRRVDENAV